MFRFALCDDEDAPRRQTRALLESYIRQHALPSQIDEFSSGQELLDAMRARLFDLYLLDVLMPGMDGLRLGAALREQDPEGLIVYLCGSPDFALQGYRVHAFSYLLKPVGAEPLFAVLDDAAALRKRQEKSVVVRTAGALTRLRLDRILYVELLHRAPHYHLADGSCVTGVTVRSSFQDAVRCLLEDGRFRLCGSSFALNLHHIRRISKTAVYFDGGHRVAVPRRAVSALRAAWADECLQAALPDRGGPAGRSPGEQK